MNKEKKGILFEKFQKLAKDETFIKEIYICKITNEISRIMKEKNLNKKQLAELMNVSPAYITKLLRGNTNFTIETLAKISKVCEFNISFEFCNEIEIKTLDNSKWVKFENLYDRKNTVINFNDYLPYDHKKVA
jgi:transcriptional regulator with XRE-family HTH domain